MSEKIAVLAIHGMGTQLPLAGIQSAVETLLRLPGARIVGVCSETRQGGGEARVVSRSMVALDADDLPKEVDVFEAHYAAIPKGKSGVIEILQFLLLAGWNGLGPERWQRWLFGSIRDCRPKRFTHSRLVLTLLALLTTIGLNTTFLVELGALWARGSVVLTNPASEYQRTLTISMIAIFIASGILGAALLLCQSLEPRKATDWSVRPQYRWLCFGAFVLSSMLPIVLIASGLYVILVGTDLLPPPRVELSGNFPWFLMVRIVGALAAAALAVRVIANRAHLRATILLAFSAGLVAYLALTYRLDPIILSHRIMVLDFVLLGFAFALASLVARMFLIDYVGDVAAYIGGSRASKFAETREAMQTRVFQMLDMLLRDGYLVVIFAHSLGSVVGYDVVNRALLDQRGYKGRIAGIVTYGSPLDKIAYLFKVEDRIGNEIRNTLIASRQPLVWENVRAQVGWWNVQAPYDIVGSRLIYYNVEPNANWNHRLFDVRNYHDATNLVPILSHTRYTDHPTLARVLHKALAKAHAGATSCPLGAPMLEVR